MDIKTRVVEKAITQKWMEIYITKKDIDKIIDVLGEVKKKAKLDKYESSIVDDLLVALQKPQIEEEMEDTAGTAVIEKAGEETKVAPTVISPVLAKQLSEVTSDNKKLIVEQVKKRFDPKNEKDAKTFARESVDFGQKQMGIKTSPKDNSVEAFYDWLVESNIINLDGSPKI